VLAGCVAAAAIALLCGALYALAQLDLGSWRLASP
jgi:hypothetical protein